MHSKEEIWLKDENVVIHLNKELSAALKDISFQEGISVSQLCKMINEKKGKTCLTIALYLFSLIYYRHKRN